MLSFKYSVTIVLLEVIPVAPAQCNDVGIGVSSN